MKKLYFGIFFVILIPVYLNRAYARIYTTIENGGFSNPTTTNPAPVQPQNPIYVALGDSLTMGAGVPDVESSFPHKLAEKIALSENIDFTLINLAVPGARVSDVIRDQLPKLKEYMPTLITLVVGVNDIHYGESLTTYSEGLDNLVDALQATGAQLVVGTVPYIGGPKIMWPPYQTYFDWQTKRYNIALLKILKTKNVTLVNLYDKTHEQALTGTDYYSRDNFHLNAAGYNTWATIFYDAIYR